MELIKYNSKYIKLVDIEDKSYKSYAHFCDKEDYETEEDGLEMKVNGEIWIFYESDIKSIEVLD